MFSMDKVRSYPIRVYLDWRALEDRTAPGDLLFSAWSPFDGMANKPAAVTRDTDSEIRTEAVTTQKLTPEWDLPVTAKAERPTTKYTQLEFTVESHKDSDLDTIRINANSVLSNEYHPKVAPPSGGGVTGTATPRTLTAWLGTGTLDTPTQNSDSSIRVTSNNSNTQSQSPTESPKLAAPAVVSNGVTRTTPALTMGAHTSGRTDNVTLPTLSRSGTIKAESSYTYNADGQAIRLTVQNDKIAVLPVDQSEAGRAALVVPGGPFDGMTIIHGLGEEGVILEGSNASARLKDALPVGVLAVTLVFSAPNATVDIAVFNEVIVGLKAGVDANEFFKGISQVSSFRPLWGTPDQFVATLNTGYGAEAFNGANHLRKDARVSFSEPNFYQTWQKHFTPNDTRLASGNLWHLVNTGQSGGKADADVDAELAWDVNPGGSANRIISIVDDGVPTNHPDLKVWVNPGEVAGDGIDNDGNGFVDDVNGWNWVAGNNSSGPTTTQDEHGTAVGGVAAAKGNNGLGVVGVSYNAQLMSSRIFEGNNTANNANTASAVYYAAGRNKAGTGSFANVGVMNNSWGGGTTATAITSAFSYATGQGRGGLGTIVTISSGNDFASTVSYPATLSATNPGVVSVGASTNLDVRSDYSNYGSALDLVTPSSGGTLDIDTTDRVGNAGYANGDYTGTGGTGFGGTSSASPLAAGIAGLVVSQSESLGVPLTAAQVRTLLRSSTDLIGGATYDMTTGKTLEYGFGRLNAFTAVSGVGKPEIDVVTATAEVLAASTTDFGIITINSVSSLTYRIRNQGTSDLVLSSLSVTSGATNYFIQTPPASMTLKSGESTKFTVGFSPTAVGALNGTVTIASNDGDEGAFLLNFTGTGRAPNIGGVVFEDWNGNGVRDTNDPGLAGQKVFLDNDDNGVISFTPVVFGFTSTPNLIIPDPDATTGNTIPVFDTIPLVGDPTILVNTVTVEINITHTWDSDLDVYLISPAGTLVNLLSAVGGSSDNFTNTVFDDLATTSINAGAAPFTGTFIPNQPLSTFKGEQGIGDWSLALIDFAAGDVGTLVNWTLNLGVDLPEPTAITDASGAYAFDDLTAGITTVRISLPPGTTGTGASLTGIDVVLLTPNDTVIGNNFGLGFNDRLYGRVYDDANFNGIWDIGELPVGGQTFFLDLNGDGVLNPPPPPTTFVNGKHLDIPDNDPAGISSGIVVAGQNVGTIISAKVTINATHSKDSDLSFSLVSPTGTVIPLVTNRGLDGQDFTVTVFDDDSSIAIADGQAPFTGIYKPESLLSVLKGTSANGTWTLLGNDNANLNTGQLIAWTLTLVVGTLEESAVSQANGNFFFDLPSGSSNAQFQSNALWQPSEPADGLIVEDAASLPLFDQQWGIKEAIPPTILPALTVNGGTAQHSSVISTTLSFSEYIAITGLPGDPFTVTGPNGTVPFTATVDNSGPTTTVTLTFASPLPDGRYTVTVDTSLITDLAGNELDPPTAPLTFHRLFGDLNGDATVNGADLVQFGNAFGSSTGDPTFLPEVDYNLDGTINGADLVNLGNIFGTTV
ncbi:hypothetical protein BH11PLA2_BH11PLA2_15580 [soil metagenome]